MTGNERLKKKLNIHPLSFKKIIMKKYLILLLSILASFLSSAQQVLKINNGAAITIQNGAQLTLQGGITLENGSNLINNGVMRLKNNPIANGSDWIDNSASGALNGTGLVIFNSTDNHNFSGSTIFYAVQINAGSLSLNNNFQVSNLLQLINGKINTATNYVFLNNSNSNSLLNDAANTGYINSWINGNFRRLITSNANVYDFPIGNATRSNLLQFANNNLTGTNYLTASFGPKPGTDAGLNVVENSAAYIAVNNGGVWYLVPDAGPSGGNYALQLYFNGFTGLTDNQFGILRRPDASSNAANWMIPAGSSLEPINGLGRKLSDGFARRINISDFSQLGVGMMGNIPCENCTVACTFGQGFYSNEKGKACYNNSGILVSPLQLMLNAFGAETSKIFGNVSNRRFFTLSKTDITNGNIFKMLPGSGNSQAIAVDNVLPYDGAYYDDKSTWYLVPIPTTGNQKGKINNQLLSQTISLWFNLRTSNTLGTIDLSKDTLVTTAQTSCGSGILTGNPARFGLPHNVVLYLNGGNGYTNNVYGLFQLANDALGGENTAINTLDVQYAVAAINNAFDGCRMLTNTIAYTQPALITKISNANKTAPEITTKKLLVTAFPNPYDKQFSLSITSPVNGLAAVEFFGVNGVKIYETKKYITTNTISIIPYKGPYVAGTILYSVNVGGYRVGGFVIHPN